MRTTIFLAVLGLASAGVIPIPVAPLVGHVATQYHAQDELGQFAYGYAGGPSAKDEVKTADGITVGGYSYIDGNGLVQTAQYVSDPVNGFRVAATNLPAGPAVPGVVAPVPISSGVIAPVQAVPLAPAVPLTADSAATVIRANPQPSTIVESAVTQLNVQQPAPVEETADEKAVVVEAEPAVTSAPVLNERGDETKSESDQEVSIEQLIHPVQDTPEVKAAKDAHLAAFEQVKVRDMAQEVHDAQENHVAPSEEQKEESEEGEESTEESSEGTEATPEATQETASEPSTAAETPVKSAIIPSVVATELAPAPGPLASPVAVPASVSQLVPSVLTREVVAAGPPAAAIPIAPALVAAPSVVAAPVVGTPSGPVALEHVGQITSQYHAQDELGQYTYGYSGGPSAKHELKTVDGQTSGGYSYIDSHGLVQTAAYVSDPVNGFRVAATNIPQPRVPEYIPDSPEVEEAKQKLFQAQAEHVAKL